MLNPATPSLGNKVIYNLQLSDPSNDTSVNRTGKILGSYHHPRVILEMPHRQHYKKGKLHHGLSSEKYKIKPTRNQSQSLQDICPADRGVRFLCLVTCYRLPHRPTRDGPTASGKICPKRLLPTEQCFRNDVNTWLGHTTAKERQRKNHYAL